MTALRESDTEEQNDKGVQPTHRNHKTMLKRNEENRCLSKGKRAPIHELEDTLLLRRQ